MNDERSNDGAPYSARDDKNGGVGRDDSELGGHFYLSSKEKKTFCSIFDRLKEEAPRVFEEVMRSNPGLQRAYDALVSCRRIREICLRNPALLGDSGYNGARADLK